jgi:hypothetical protein
MTRRALLEVRQMAEPIVVNDDDDRAERMLADPKGYFERARERARAQVRREVADGLNGRRLREHPV